MKYRALAGCLLLLANIVSAALAQTSNSKDIALKGKVVASPCIVEQENMRVNLGDNIDMNTLAAAGAFTDWVGFDVRVYDCPLQNTAVSIVFNGAADASDPDSRYQNSGTATNVAVELRAADGTPLGDGKTLTGAIVNQEVTWNLRARVWTPTGNVRPGTVSAVVSATLTWQ